MGRYSRLGKNTALVFIGTAGSKLINLFMLPMYTTWLSVSNYASVDLITTYSGLMLGIVSCCIYESLFIFPKNRSKTEQSEYFTSGVVFGAVTILITGFLCGIAKYIGSRYGLHGFVIEYLWLIYGVLGISYLQTLVQQFLRAIDKMVLYSSTGIVMTVSMVVLSFMLIPDRGVFGYVQAIVFANLIAIIYSVICGRLWTYLSLSLVRIKKLKEMLHYSVPLIPNGIMWFLMNSLNRPVLESWTGLVGVGLFAVAGRIPNLLNTVYLLFHNAWMISVLEEAKKESYVVFYNQMLKSVVILQVLLAVVLAFCGEWIIRIFTTPDYYSAWQYIPLLVIGVIFMNIAGFVASNFAVTRESKYFFYSSVWAGIASVVLNFTLIPILGLWGACWAIIISQAVCMFSRIYYSWKCVKVTNISFYLKNLIFLAGSVVSCLMFNGTITKCVLTGVMMIYFILVNKRQLAECVGLLRARIR